MTELTPLRQRIAALLVEDHDATPAADQKNIGAAGLLRRDDRYRACCCRNALHRDL